MCSLVRPVLTSELFIVLSDHPSQGLVRHKFVVYDVNTSYSVMLPNSSPQHLAGLQYLYRFTSLTHLSLICTSAQAFMISILRRMFCSGIDFQHQFSVPVILFTLVCISRLRRSLRTQRYVGLELVFVLIMVRGISKRRWRAGNSSSGLTLH